MKRTINLLNIKNRWIFLSITFIVFNLCVFYNIYVHADDSKRVLYISSYNYAFDTVPYQIKGMNEIFENEGIQYDMEFMDEKRFTDNLTRYNFYIMLKNKLENSPRYDAIIVSDDAALEFAMKYRDELFKDIPIIYNCINDKNRAADANAMEGFVGITEENPVKETIDMAYNIYPLAARIISIVDNTLTGIGDMNRFYGYQKDFPNLKFEHINVSEYTMEEVCKIVSELETDTILMHQSSFEDKEGIAYAIPQSIALISEAASVPVFKVSLGTTNTGALGGCEVSYEEQGKNAAIMVMDILNGVDINSIEGQDNTVICKVDYNILKKYDINVSKLPKDAVVDNKNISFFEKYSQVIKVVAIIIAILTAIIMVIGYDDIKRRRIQKELYESEKRYRELAYTDVLTGLGNRVAFQNKMSAILNVPDSKGALLFLDLDDFKYINDTYGHEYGDNILKLISDQLKSLISDNVFIARLGGDEFVVTVEDLINMEKIQSFANNLLHLVSVKYEINGTSHYVTLSIGIARYPYEGRTYETLIKNADIAMYQAKQKGKNRHAFFLQKMGMDIQKKLAIQNCLRIALENKEFWLEYQPNVDTNSSNLVGFETLIRWRSKELGIVYPNEFIYLAEESGFIIEIGNWVLESACIFAKAINSNTNRKLIVTTNISGVQIIQPDFVDNVKNIIRKTGVSPELIGIEITETALIDSLHSNAKKLQKLRDMGVISYLDDFGTGYSSLNYLKELPVSVVKIDKSFIDDLGNKQLKSNITADIIMIAHKLGLKVVAEGVETKEQLEILQSFGCDIIQGYYMSKPLAQDIAKEYIDKGSN